jgi:UDP-N-acetylmuramoylalanine--D-glutamate ligase
MEEHTKGLEAFFKGKKVLVWGLGREGRAFLRLAQKWTGVSLSLTDRKEPSDIGKLVTAYRWFSEDQALKQWDCFDWVLKSPGVCLRRFGVSGQKADKILSQSELLVRFAPGLVIGITGTKGKSTTSALLYQMLVHGGRRSRIAGNIGIAPLEIWEELDPNTLVVCELSSYQLECMHVSPRVAVWLNLFPEHLDYHGGFESYRSAKARIALFQEPRDWLVYRSLDPGIQEALKLFRPKGERIPFDRSPTVDLPESPYLLGNHNRLNLRAAATTARLLGVDPRAIAEAIASFRGLPHRLQQVSLPGGVRFFDDSISTVPQATLAALEAVPDTATLILGGQDRGIPYEAFVSELVQKPKLSTLILLPPSGWRLHSLLVSQDPPFSGRVLLAENLEAAVELAVRHTPKGASCLFSPAAPSAPPFRNFEERGKAFQELLQALIKG